MGYTPGHFSREQSMWACWEAHSLLHHVCLLKYGSCLLQSYFSDRGMFSMSTSAIFQHLSTLIEVSKPTFSGLMHISLSLFTADSPKNGIYPLPVDLVVTEPGKVDGIAFLAQIPLSQRMVRDFCLTPPLSRLECVSEAITGGWC